VCEIVALRREAFALVEPHMRALLEAGDQAALARLAGDHAEGSIELSPHQWKLLMKHSRERVSELIPVVQQRISTPAHYTSVFEALGIEDAVTLRLPRGQGVLQQAPIARPPRAGKSAFDPTGGGVSNDGER